MKIGFIGLGKMGANMVRRLLLGGHQVVGYNRSPEISRILAEEAGMIPVFSIEELISKLDTPRTVWIMLPSGTTTEDMFINIKNRCDRGDVLIDGGNSNFKDSMRRAELAKSIGIGFVDAGVSGGIWGLKEGYSIMLGGEKDNRAGLTH